MGLGIVLALNVNTIQILPSAEKHNPSYWQNDTCTQLPEFFKNENI